MPIRELSQSTQREYRAALRRAFGEPSTAFGDAEPIFIGGRELPREAWEHLNYAGRTMLRSALRWADPVEGARLAETIPHPQRTRRRVKYPTSEEIARFERGIIDLPRCDFLVLKVMLKLGTRTEELLSLSRAQVADAVKRGVLIFVRKGDVEHELPVKHIAMQLRLMLKTQVPTDDGVRDWNYVYELISLLGVEAAHRRLNRVIKRVAAKQGLESNWRPHMLRHAFATELIRDGATLPVVQRALGHASYQTTIKNYVHVDTKDLEKWLKED